MIFYSSDDKRNRRPNPSKIPIDGDIYSGLATLKSAANLYARFLRDETSLSTEVATSMQAVETATALKIFRLEQDFQAALRSQIGQLERGLKVIDGGVERSVASGFIDITAEDQSNAIVVIELKAGKAGREAVGQILSYMGDLAREEPNRRVRGIIVAADFDHKIRSAASLAGIDLKAYRLSFQFLDGYKLQG